ncbi:MAG: hypothetical protein V4789_28765, partial [Burkholderia gladioli]
VIPGAANRHIGLQSFSLTNEEGGQKICPLSMDRGQIEVNPMKSQDILLLLKLVALERSQKAGDVPPHDKAQDERTSGSRDEHENTLNHDASRASASPGLNPAFDPYSVRGLSSATGISKSEVSNALARCYANGLAKSSRLDGKPSVNRRGLEEFLCHGIRYVFPAATLGPARGIPTSLTAPIFRGVLRSGAEQGPVWSAPQGETLGLAVEPLYRTASLAIRGDDILYRLLAIVDSLRLGQPRERKVAVNQLQELFDY